MRSFYSKIAGVLQKNTDGSLRQEIIKKYCHKGDLLFIFHEPDNSHDENAIAVWIEVKGWFSKKQYQLGYLPSDVAKSLILQLSQDSSLKPVIKIKSITGDGFGKRTRGVNIEITI